MRQEAVGANQTPTGGNSIVVSDSKILPDLAARGCGQLALMSGLAFLPDLDDAGCGFSSDLAQRSGSTLSWSFGSSIVSRRMC